MAAAAAILRQGGTVIIPTETVYGLAANALDPVAVAKIFAAKGRPADNPLIVHIAATDQLAPLVRAVPPVLPLLAEHFWPGPLTLVLPRAPLVPDITAAGMDTVAVRLPQNPVARAIITAAGVPLAAPSANRSGIPSPTTFAHCLADMDGRVDAIVQSAPCAVGLESTVLSLAGAVPRLLRPGAVTLEQLRAVLGTVEVDEGVTHHLADNQPVSSPGMKYRHYAPKAELLLLVGSTQAYCDYLTQNARVGDFALCFTEDLPQLTLPALCYGGRQDHAAQAERLFGLLRELDDRGALRGFVHAPSTEGVGLAVYNRLLRAAAFQLLEL
ncbi:MAG: L-threonylcarbamoyladenylate synthase [Angelakisella sp.]